MSAFACWRRLDVPGHDAVLLSPRDGGWSLRGTAVFKDPAGPASVDYSVEIDRHWRTESGRVRGFVADREFDHSISRKSDGWYLDGARIDGLGHLLDLDYGFTPATNMQQLRRVAIAPGEAADIHVVWFDIDRATLIELPQRYERRDATRYWYMSPMGPYEAMLEMAENGFVRSYPELWVMEG